MNLRPHRSTRSLETAQRRVYYRAWCSGTKEGDVLFGTFATALIDTLDEANLRAFERLIDLPADVVRSALLHALEPTGTDADRPCGDFLPSESGEHPVVQTGLFQRFVAFHRDRPSRQTEPDRPFRRCATGP